MKEEFKVAILDMYDGYPNEGMRCIKMLVNEFIEKNDIKGSFTVYNVRGKLELPALDSYQAFISTGGPGSPIITGTEWEKKFFSFYDDLTDHNKVSELKKPLFLICHSFQLVVQHLKLAEVNKRKSTSFGVMPIHKTEEGEQDESLQDLGDPFWAVDSRDFQVVQPDEERFVRLGAEILAKEKIRPHIPLERAIMCIRFTPEVLGVQFHPEADADGMRHYFLQDDKRKAVIDEHGIEKYQEMIDRLDDVDKIMYTESIFLPQFLASSFFQNQSELGHV